MNSPQRSFDQVKSILGKLDRNIEAARARRMQDRAGPAITPAVVAAAAPAPAHPPAPIPVSSAGPASIVPATPGGGRSTFGRATPMRFTRPTPLNNTGS